MGKAIREQLTKMARFTADIKLSPAASQKGVALRIRVIQKPIYIYFFADLPIVPARLDQNESKRKPKERATPSQMPSRAWAISLSLENVRFAPRKNIVMAAAQASLWRLSSVRCSLIRLSGL
jgi:hypothetical protein